MIKKRIFELIFQNKFTIFALPNIPIGILILIKINNKMVSSSTTSPNVKKAKSIYQYKFNSIKLSALESNLKELAEEDVSTVSLDEKKDTESTFASTQGSPDNPMNVSLISEMFVKHYAEAKPTCFLKTKVKTFE